VNVFIKLKELMMSPRRPARKKLNERLNIIKTLLLKLRREIKHKDLNRYEEIKMRNQIVILETRIATIKRKIRLG